MTRTLWICATVAAVAVLANAVAGSPVPLQKGWVTDSANALSLDERDRLSALLAQYHDETHHQLAVLTVSSLAGEPIEQYSLRVANAWQLGYRDVDNGILVTLAMQERKVRIELGRGMEPYISDELAKQIIDEAMIPAFRKKDFAGGLEAGLKRLMAAARGFAVTPPAEMKYGEILPSGQMKEKYRLSADTRQKVILNAQNIPSDLRDLAPLAEKWGIADDIVREDFQSKASGAEKQALSAALKGRNARITNWLNTFPKNAPLTEEAAAFMYMQLGLDEMGLWQP